MNKLYTIFTLFLLVTVFFTGYAIRDLQGQYTADQYLIEKNQQYKAESLGWEQLYETANAGIKTEEFLTLKSPLDNDEKENEIY